MCSVFSLIISLLSVCLFFCFLPFFFFEHVPIHSTSRSGDVCLVRYELISVLLLLCDITIMDGFFRLGFCILPIFETTGSIVAAACRNINQQEILMSSSYHSCIYKFDDRSQQNRE